MSRLSFTASWNLPRQTAAAMLSGSDAAPPAAMASSRSIIHRQTRFLSRCKPRCAARNDVNVKLSRALYRAVMQR